MSEPTKVTREQIASFRSLLQELTVESKKLVESNKELKAENARLKKENAKLTDKLAVRGASASSFTQKERLVLKQHLSSLIKRIDHHLEENA